jgi:hypothetical protein
MDLSPSQLIYLQYSVCKKGVGILLTMGWIRYERKPELSSVLTGIWETA